MMMRKKTKWPGALLFRPQWQPDCLQDVEVMEERKVRVEALQRSSAKTESSAGDTADTSDRPTYKIATVRWTDTWPTDFLHEGVMKEIEDKMNINIDWQVYYNSDWSEQKSLLLASGDLRMHFLAPSA